MRGSRTFWIALGAAVSAGLLAELAASAAGFTLGTSSGSTTGSTTGTTSGLATSITTATPEDVNTALFALAAGGKTTGGPSVFLAGADGSQRIYEVTTGGAPPICVTLRNLSGGQVRVRANGATSTDVDGGETRTACYGMVNVVDLICRQGSNCQAVWRIDRQ